MGGVGVGVWVGVEVGVLRVCRCKAMPVYE